MSHKSLLFFVLFSFSFSNCLLGMRRSEARQDHELERRPANPIQTDKSLRESIHQAQRESNLAHFVRFRDEDIPVEQSVLETFEAYCAEMRFNHPDESPAYTRGFYAIVNETIPWEKEKKFWYITKLIKDLEDFYEFNVTKEDIKILFNMRNYLKLSDDLDTNLDDNFELIGDDLELPNNHLLKLYIIANRLGNDRAAKYLVLKLERCVFPTYRSITETFSPMKKVSKEGFVFSFLKKTVDKKFEVTKRRINQKFMRREIQQWETSFIFNYKKGQMKILVDQLDDLTRKYYLPAIFDKETIGLLQATVNSADYRNARISPLRSLINRTRTNSIFHLGCAAFIGASIDVLTGQVTGHSNKITATIAAIFACLSSRLPSYFSSIKTIVFKSALTYTFYLAHYFAYCFVKDKCNHISVRRAIIISSITSSLFLLESEIIPLLIDKFVTGDAPRQIRLEANMSTLDAMASLLPIMETFDEEDEPDPESDEEGQ